MKPLQWLSLALLPLLACNSEPAESDWKHYFDQHGVHGCFILYDQTNDQLYTYNQPRLDSPYLPASTFKVINSMIVLEESTIANEEEIIPWDSVEREFSSWNRDHNLRSAIEFSAVWFYQELARRVGEERMQYWVKACDYGNRDISGGIDMFWLTGNIRITAREQIEFLRKLYADELPFSQRNMDIVKDIMIREQTDTYVFRHKTGWANSPDPDIGWLVGWVEQEDKPWFFAMNIDIRKNEDAKARLVITRSILKEAGLLE